jgi:uncharacterized membrane protein YfcA
MDAGFLNILHLVITFVVGVIACSYATLSGGRGLLTIPTLILLGLPPHTAIGTDRLGGIGMNIAGWYEFHQKGMVNYKIGLTIVVPALMGSILGANLVLQINETVLRRVVASITILAMALIILRPKIGIERVKSTTNTRDYVFGAILSFFTFVYHGFYGVGAGSLLAYVLVLLFGQTFLESAATRKIANLMATVMGSTVFVLEGVVSYPLGIALFSGCFVGSYIGAHYSDKIGNVWIRRLFLVIVLIMAIKLLR